MPSRAPMITPATAGRSSTYRAPILAMLAPCLAATAFLPQIGEMPEGIEIAGVTVVPPVELQKIEPLDAHPPERDADRLLDDPPRHRAGRRHPFGEGLDLAEPLLAATAPELAAERADQLLGRAVMVGQVPGREARVGVAEHRLDRPPGVDRAMCARHLPHPVQDAANRTIGGKLKPARCGQCHSWFQAGEA